MNIFEFEAQKQQEINDACLQMHMAQQSQQEYINPFVPIKYSGNKLKEKKSMFKSFREYISKHSDIIFTVFILYLADKHMFNGAFRSRIEKLLGGLLDKAEKKIGQD